MADAVKLISVGSLRGPHGLKGMVKAKVGLEDYDLLVEAGPLQSADGRTFKVTRWQQVGQGMLALTIEGITSIDAAETLKGIEVFLDRNRWPEDEDEVYLDQLVGADITGPDGTLVGTVKATVELPAGPALEVEMDGVVKVIPLEEAFLQIGETIELTELGLAVLHI
ncbi:MAG: 16S rRNA processing protein RimM [Alphaproteobacteria bacterium]|nr:MAG: 16S rRNA processing protein RimM [Alphaproteobacteria bacterium]